MTEISHQPRAVARMPAAATSSLNGSSATRKVPNSLVQEAGCDLHPRSSAMLHPLGKFGVAAGLCQRWAATYGIYRPRPIVGNQRTNAGRGPGLGAVAPGPGPRPAGDAGVGRLPGVGDAEVTPGHVPVEDLGVR